jgi:oxalate decarboxylase/phosphoglucose isomerase-like protein (cupin superfamily)
MKNETITETVRNEIITELDIIMIEQEELEKMCQKENIQAYIIKYKKHESLVSDEMIIEAITNSVRLSVVYEYLKEAFNEKESNKLLDHDS